MDNSPTRRTLVARVRPPSVRPLHLLHFNLLRKTLQPMKWKIAMNLKPQIKFSQRITQLVFYCYSIQYSQYLHSCVVLLIKYYRIKPRVPFLFFTPGNIPSPNSTPGDDKKFLTALWCPSTRTYSLLCLECHPSCPVLCCYHGNVPFSCQYSGRRGVIHNMCCTVATLIKYFPLFHST
jgi:hypothetical protein